MIADFFNISVTWPASKTVVKAVLYEALVTQQIFPEREVLPGVPNRPPQVSDTAGADKEPESWLGNEAFFEWIWVGSVDPGMQIALKELELEIKRQVYKMQLLHIQEKELTAEGKTLDLAVPCQMPVPLTQNFSSSAAGSLFQSGLMSPACQHCKLLQS